jgi:hypothetical protein
MSVEIQEASGRTVTFRVTGQMKQLELAAAQQKVAEFIKKVGKVRFLVLIEDFLGVDKAGDWGDVSFQAQYDEFIERIAIVGEQRWEDVTLLFTGKGIRHVPIEYFQPTELAKAKAWLAEK